jgi:hypothetical protein
MVARKKKAAPQPAMEYNSGFVGLRFTATDETTGESITVPGVYARLRCDRIDAYHAGEPGTVIIYLRGQAEPGCYVGTVDDLDQIMRRHRFAVLTNGKDEAE